MPASVAIIVVPGVGDHPAGETVTQVAQALTTEVPGYAWTAAPDPEPLRVDVHSSDEGVRQGERYDAERRRLVREDGTAIELIEMRWSDLSSFPKKGLLAFFASAFGLGLQIATAGLDATRPEEERSGGRAWIMGGALVVALAAALAISALVAGEIDPSWFLGAGALAGAALLGILARAARPGTAEFANGLMEAASWWVAAVIVPVTLVAALAGTALWLVVDEPLEINDWLAVVGVVVVGYFALTALGRGIAAGGWSYAEGRWKRVLHPPHVTLALFLAAIGVGTWRGVEVGSVEGGLGQTVLIAGGYGVRPAWMLGAVLVALALLALALRHFRKGGSARAAFTSMSTTVLSPLLVALIGTVLVGGIGAVAFSSAKDATWGETAPALRCLSGATDWTWGRDCGPKGVSWEALSDTIPTRLEAARDLESEASRLRRAGIRGGGAQLSEAAGREARADALRGAAERVEDDAEAAPTTWATEVLELSMLPLLPIVVALIAALVLASLGVLAARPLWHRLRSGQENPPGSRLTAALGAFTGRAGTATVAALGLAGCCATVALWTRLDLQGAADKLPHGDGTRIWATAATAILAGLVLARVIPVDPRKLKDEVGGALEKLRTGLDIVYDVATYLRIDREEDGVRSRIVARYRALLAHVEAGAHTHVIAFAHSQGSMYTLATLFGDRARGEPEKGSAWGVRPWKELHPAPGLAKERLALLTFGCPIRQTYRERLPGQYEWVDDDDLSDRLDLIGTGWVNAYRARDYIGRRVFTPSLEPAEITQGTGTSRPLRRAAPSAGPPLVDVCIHGTGSHTGYFGDPELMIWLDYLIRRSLGPWVPPPDRTRYKITPPLRARTRP